MRIELAFAPIRALVRAAESFRVAPVLLLSGGGSLLLLTAFNAFLSFVFGDLERVGDSIVSSPFSVLGSILFGGCCVKLAVQPLHAWIFSGFANSLSTVAHREPATFDLMFSAHPWFGVFLTSLVSSVLLSVVSLYLLGTSLVAAVLDTFFLPEPSTTLTMSLLISLVFLPFLAWVWLGVLAAPYIAALTDWSPVRALRTSWRFARGRRLRFLYFRLVTWAASLLGLLACGVGVLASWSIAEAAWVEAVREALAEEEAQRKAATVASSADSIETSSE